MPGIGTYHTERDEFIAAVTAPICSMCPDAATPATVRYEGRLYCAWHAFDELVLDLGRHGYLAIPALSYAGFGR